MASDSDGLRSIAIRLQQIMHQGRMVLKLPQRRFLSLKIDLGMQGGQSLLFEAGNQLLLLGYPQLAIGDESKIQSARIVVARACHEVDGPLGSLCEAESLQVLCNWVF